jgi:hypothetical protein
MHRGVQAVISWITENPGFPGLNVGPAATPSELNELQDAISAPLPSDLRLLLSHWNGGQLPTGTLLRAAGDGAGSILGALRELAARLGRPADDPELPLPYFLGADEALLAFDRSAAPVADTWPVIDCPPQVTELRLVHRTFDGWCRLCLASWTAPDFGERFSLDGYLRSGERHAEVEPDVSAAHATVAHALRRCGRPEDALESYLRAGRCVPSLPWCDWEALKLAILLGNVPYALEVGRRLCQRAPRAGWEARSTTPARVAEVLGLLVAHVDPPDPLLGLLDQLAAQADEDEQRIVAAVRRAVFSGEALPPTHAVRSTLVPDPTDPDAFYAQVEQAYRKGAVRDEDLLLDPSYRKLDRHRPLADLLRIRREF